MQRLLHSVNPSPLEAANRVRSLSLNGGCGQLPNQHSLAMLIFLWHVHRLRGNPNDRPSSMILCLSSFGAFLDGASGLAAFSFPEPVPPALSRSYIDCVTRVPGKRLIVELRSCVPTIGPFICFGKTNGY